VRTAELRQKQVEHLASTLSRIPEVEPFLVAGDFNLVPLHRAYRPLARVARDSWREAGWGFGFTWPTRRGDGRLPPLVRIDYLWHSPTLRPISIRVLPDETGSDHYGVLGEYLIR
jgi:endonuclease/exonuclease/phosphatase (EEP) superfamily protein YafD